MTHDGDRDGSAASGDPDSFLRAVAGASERTMPSRRAADDGGDPVRLAHFRVLGRIGQGGMGVLARWGRAKPRSVTAEKARARSKAFGCGDRP